jgi:hypothetical protein
MKQHGPETKTENEVEILWNKLSQQTQHMKTTNS